MGAGTEISKKTVPGAIEISELWKGHSKVDIERAGRARDLYRTNLSAGKQAKKTVGKVGK